MFNFRAWCRVRFAQKALLLNRMASAWQILQIGQRSIVAHVLKQWRARALHQRQGIIRKLMAFSEVRQSRAEALRRQDTFDMLRAGIETQIQQRRQRAIAQVHSQRMTFRWVADTILKRHKVYRWAKGSVAAHVQLLTQVLSCAKQDGRGMESMAAKCEAFSVLAARVSGRNLEGMASASGFSAAYCTTRVTAGVVFRSSSFASEDFLGSTA